MNQFQKYILLPFFLIVGIVPTFAQDIDVQWGEITFRKGSLLSIMPYSDSSFYTLRWSGSRMFGSYVLSSYDNFNLKNSTKLKMYVDNGMANFEDVHMINGQPVLFLSDKKLGKNNLFIRIMDPSLGAVKEEKKIAEYVMEKGHEKGWFQILESKNKNFFAVVWEIPAKGDNRDRYGFKVFDKEFNEINEGEYPVPFERELSEIHAHHVSNKGDYFLTVTEYEKRDEKKGFRNKLDFKALHIFHLGEDGLQDYTLDVRGKRVEAMALSSDSNNIFTITGIYGEPDEYGVKGVFYQRLDLLAGKVLIEGFKEFDEDFITQGWTEREVKRAKKREDKGKGEPQLYNFKMREAVLLSDGSIVGTMEQYFVQSRTYTDSRTGQTTVTYYYYYNDIICYKIGSNGEFEWMDKIRKYQVSTNDGGPFSSYSIFVVDGQLYFVFNDSSENYNESGEYLNPDQVEMTNYSKKKNVVALVKLDLNTGEQVRNTMFGRSEVKTIAVPKLFSSDVDFREVILYTVIGNKEKFGKIRY